MPAIPSFLLKKLYVKKSLRNTETGFEFTIKNNLAPASLTALTLEVDGQEQPLDKITAIVNDTQTKISDISAGNPLSFSLNTDHVLQVEGEPLASGSHDIFIVVATKEAGELEIPITASI